MKSIFYFFFLIGIISNAQDRNSVWCFGDSAGVDFSSGSPVLFTSGIKSRGSCASITDSGGELLFSAYTRATFPGNTTLVKNSFHDLMVNGNNVVGRGWYQEVVIVPFPEDSNRYYIFSIGMTSIFGLYYSVVDMTLDSGRGAVTLKNVQLLNVQASDGINAVRHGNGRDWWVIFRRADAANDEYFEYLVTPTGISGPAIIHAGSLVQTNLFKCCFAPDGNKFACIDTRGLIELFDFDRCTGSITLNQTISPENTGAPYPFYSGVAFSTSENYLYISAAGVGHPTYLVQYNLTAPDISLTADTLWTYSVTDEAGGQLKLAPDGKIYLACVYIDGTVDYPYADTSFNTVNNNLSVINYPDSPGVACGFAPFSFNLGAGRCYWGLPNNPDYELGAVVNSMCDTVTGVQSIKYEVSREELHVFYHAGWQVAFINAEGLRGRKFSLQVFDLYGRMIYSEEGSLSSAYFTKDLPFDAFANGMYIVTLRTDKEVLSKKFIKE